MKNILRSSIALILAFSCCQAKADESHGGSEWHPSFLNGKWVITSAKTIELSSSSDDSSHDHDNHDHGDASHDHETASEHNHAQIKFHTGHSHLPKRNKRLAVMQFCADRDGKLYGKVIQNKIHNSSKKLDVSELNVVNHEFLVSLNQSGAQIAEDAEPVSLRMKPFANTHKKLYANFDGSNNFYTLKHKSSKISKSCQKLMNAAQ